MDVDHQKRAIFGVMLSSTFKDLAEHREAVRRALMGQRLLPIAMEDDAALPGKDLISASLSKVDEADAYVGLISYRYGQAPVDAQRNPDGLSLTELEFRRALDRKIPICMFIMHDDHLVPRSAVGAERGVDDKHAAFVALAKGDRIYAEFKSVDDLRAKCVQSLVELRKVLEMSGKTPQSRTGGARWEAISNIPFRVPHHFLGRNEDLAAIESALNRGNGFAAVTAALHGLRGVGKTTLAAAYAERSKKRYRATWWIRAETDATMRADVFGLGMQLGWVKEDMSEEAAVKAVLNRLSSDGQDILLVYDNAMSLRRLTRFLPQAAGTHIIITSNAPNWGDSISD
jgi:hypothetical protein